MTPAVRIMYTAQLATCNCDIHTCTYRASIVPRPETARRKGPGLISTICTCAKSWRNSNGTVDIGLCSTTCDIEADNVIRTLKLAVAIEASGICYNSSRLCSPMASGGKVLLD